MPDGVLSRAKRGAGRHQALGEAAAGSSPASVDARRAVASSPVAADADASNAAVVFEYDPEYIERKCGWPAPTNVQCHSCGPVALPDIQASEAVNVRRYEIMTLRVIHRRRRTGFEETKDFPIRVNDLIAGRYQVPHLPLTYEKPAHGHLHED